MPPSLRHETSNPISRRRFQRTVILHALRWWLRRSDDYGVVEADIALTNQLQPLTEQTAVRELIDAYRHEVSAPALARGTTLLEALQTADEHVSKAVERGIIPELRAAIDAHGHRASKSVLTGAQATLQQLEADDALRFGRQHRHEHEITQALEAHRALASAEAVAQTIARLHELRAGDVALSNAQDKFTEGCDIPALKSCIAANSSVATPELVAAAEAQLAVMEAAEALRISRLEADAALRGLRQRLTRWTRHSRCTAAKLLPMQSRRRRRSGLCCLLL